MECSIRLIKIHSKVFSWICWRSISINIPIEDMAQLLRLCFFIIYSLVAHLRLCRQKAPPSLSLLYYTILCSPLPFCCHFFSPAGPDSSHWRELLALLQTVCQLQCRVHGGKRVFRVFHLDMMIFFFFFYTKNTPALNGQFLSVL